MSRIAVPSLPRPVRLVGAGVVALAILVASVVDPPGTGTTTTVLGIPGDKWLHALSYATLAATLSYATLPGRPRNRTLLVVVALTAGFGFGIELLQATLAYRTFDLGDALANLVGAAVGTLPWRVIHGRDRSRTEE